MATPYANASQSQGYYPPLPAHPSAQQATPDPSQAAGSSSQAPASSQASRQTAEEARKDRTLAEFLLMLDDYEPLVCLSGSSCLRHQHIHTEGLLITSHIDTWPVQIPNEVTDYYLQRVGFECEDVRL